MRIIYNVARKIFVPLDLALVPKKLFTFGLDTDSDDKRFENNVWKW
jgi:hypothetical protein